MTETCLFDTRIPRDAKFEVASTTVEIRYRTQSHLNQNCQTQSIKVLRLPFRNVGKLYSCPVSYVSVMNPLLCPSMNLYNGIGCRVGCSCLA